MRKENNFIELLNKKKVIIPIIQRDYAQGRLNKKAQAVRERLIEDIIDAMKNNENRIDFNFIYGNETDEIFYPVDGQQRLTSLYLLYWYLAFANNQEEIIKNWTFEYQTRNSALEFFYFLKDIEKSKELYELLKEAECTDEQKEKNIKNQSWFKGKWTNDPTVMGCIIFLIMLARKLKDYEGELNYFWNRIINDNPAIYFTYLPESTNGNAEVGAAKKYTRMNARGKKLTEFENLKAMIDEIEKNEKDNLTYADTFNDTMSYKYDEIYIQSLYNSFREKDDTNNELNNNIIMKINTESFNWFKEIYDIYSILFQDNNSNELYENVMYNISQKRTESKNIPQYLYMLKAVHEVLYNNEERKSVYNYEDFDKDKRMAFVIFLYKMWDKKNNEQDNYKIISQWERFSNMLDDLNYEEWQNKDEFPEIINTIVKAVVKFEGVNNFFVNNNFEQENPFDRIELDDIFCRVQEQIIKSKLLIDNVIDNYTCFDNIAVGKRRFGYFLNITDCVYNWNNKLDMQNSKEKIEKYLKIFQENELPESFNYDENFLKAYAYASYYNTQKNELRSPEEINEYSEKNEHIWEGNSFLYWNDQNEHKKEDIHIKHLKTTMELVCKFMGDKEDSTKIFEKFIESINNWFLNTTGYEKCWLRMAIKNEEDIKEILTERLKLDSNNNVVTEENNEIPFILRIYLTSKAYSLKTGNSKGENRIDIDRIKRKIFWKGVATIYSEIDETLTFEPSEDDEKYRHSKNEDLYMSVKHVNKNIDLQYEAQLNIENSKYINGNVFSYEHTPEGIEIIVYEIGKVKNNLLEINLEKTLIENSELEKIRESENIWQEEFEKIKKSKETNYDKWVEIAMLSERNSSFEFFNEKLSENVKLKCGAGQRPSKKWIEKIKINNTKWNDLKDVI